MDSGTVPEKDAINKLYWSLESNSDLGGVCGYMKVEPETINDKDKESKDFFTEFLNNYIFDI
jgi:cellulose synthase/poly-beta-1,6-N-acetylglucosamine synthase-like glycosyltransferase